VPKKAFILCEAFPYMKCIKIDDADDFVSYNQVLITCYTYNKYKYNNVFTLYIGKYIEREYNTKGGWTS
jgi:hypothetical protein